MLSLLIGFIRFGAGCATNQYKPTPQSASVESAILAGNAGGRITARAGFIQGQIAKLSILAKDRPETPISSVAPHFETIDDEAGNIKIDQADADAANVAERQQQTATIAILAHKVEERDGWIGDLKIQIATRDARWYTKVGQFIDGICWTIGVSVKWLLYGSIIAYILSAVAAIVLPQFFPIAGLGVSKFIVRALPLMGWVSRIRDGILGARGKAVK